MRYVEPLSDAIDPLQPRKPRVPGWSWSGYVLDTFLAAKRAGVVTDFHNLRHAFETWLVDHDVPSPVQKALMGHSAGSVTEGYAHPSLEKMRECVNRLPRLLLPTKDE